MVLSIENLLCIVHCDKNYKNMDILKGQFMQLVNFLLIIQKGDNFCVFFFAFPYGAGVCSCKKKIASHEQIYFILELTLLAKHENIQF